MRHVPLADRFWAKVAKGDGCWEWTAYRNPDGYGVVGLDFRGTDRTHRVAWRLAVGPIPEGLQVLHHCDNPGCVRPDHLWLGTQADNVADMGRKGRARKNPRRGSANNLAKLNEADIPVIRKLFADGLGDTVIARRYGVHRVTIHWIRIGKNWAHLSTYADGLLPDSPLRDEAE